MPITKSAQKALRQSLKRKNKNLKQKDAIQKAIKVFKKLVAEKKKGEAQKQLATLYRLLDKAAKTNLIHKNNAARRKSRLARALKP